MVLSSECSKGHTTFTWNCNKCEEKLKAIITWEIYLESTKK